MCPSLAGHWGVVAHYYGRFLSREILLNDVLASINDKKTYEECANLVSYQGKANNITILF